MTHLKYLAADWPYTWKCFLGGLHCYHIMWLAANKTESKNQQFIDDSRNWRIRDARIVIYWLVSNRAFACPVIGTVYILGFSLVHFVTFYLESRYLIPSMFLATQISVLSPGPHAYGIQLMECRTAPTTVLYSIDDLLAVMLTRQYIFVDSPFNSNNNTKSKFRLGVLWYLPNSAETHDLNPGQNQYQIRNSGPSFSPTS